MDRPTFTNTGITLPVATEPALTVRMVRWAYAPQGTYGTLTLPDGSELYTVEQPWAGNAVGRSCIPEGDYWCAPRRYFRGGYDAVEITGVPGRSAILVHVANVPADVRGCIGLGVGLGWVKGSWAVTSSREAFQEFMRQLGEVDRWRLTITHYPTHGLRREVFEHV